LEAAGADSPSPRMVLRRSVWAAASGAWAALGVAAGRRVAGA